MPSLPLATFTVMTGGAIGAGLRFLVGRMLPVGASGWPHATLLVNISGALAMGVLAGWLHGRGDAEGWRLLLGVGLLGGFTTFSAFSLELARMLQGGPLSVALAYALASVVGSVLALFAGLAIARMVA